MAAGNETKPSPPRVKRLGPQPFNLKSRFSNRPNTEARPSPRYW